MVTERLPCAAYPASISESIWKERSSGGYCSAKPDYDPGSWWCYSDGVREVIGESIAYIYARVFFWPAAAKPRKKEIHR